MPEHRDPLDALHDFDPGAAVPPPPAAEIRRRGEHRRRRRTALAAAGAALAIVVVATPLVLLTGGDERAVEPAVPDEPTTLSADADLLDASEVPAREGLDPWEVDNEGRADDTPVITCAPDPIEVLEPATSLERTFVSDFSLPPGTTADPSAPDVPGGQAKEAVLEFADVDAADEAYDEASDWLDDCSGDDQARNLDFGDSSGAGQRTNFISWSLGAADACLDSCDLARFVDLAVTQIRNRLVLTSTQVVTGPQPPDDFEAVDDYRDAARAKARPGVDTPEGANGPTESTTSEPATDASGPDAAGGEIPADFPLDAGTDFAAGSDFRRTGPAPSSPGIRGLRRPPERMVFRAGRCRHRLRRGGLHPGRRPRRARG